VRAGLPLRLGNGSVHDLAKADDALRFGESPGAMSVQGGLIIDQRIRGDLAVAARADELLDVSDQPCAEAAPSKQRIDPDALEKWHRPAVTTVGVGAQGKLGKTGGRPICRLDHEPPALLAAQHDLDVTEVRVASVIGPQGAAHVRPASAI